MVVRHFVPVEVPLQVLGLVNGPNGNQVVSTKADRENDVISKLYGKLSSETQDANHQQQKVIDRRNHGY